MQIVTRIAGPALTALSLYFVAKDFTFSAASSIGKYASESVFSSPYFIVLFTCVLFIFLASYLPLKRLQDRRFSVAIIAMFFVVLLSSKAVVKHVKEQVYTPQFLSAKSYLNNERTLKQVYDDNGIKNKADMNRFAISLMRASSDEEAEVFRHVVKDNMGWLENPFDVGAMTLNCAIYGDAETFDFLRSKGLIDIEAPLKYGRSALRSLSGKKFFTPLEVARMESNRAVERRILAILAKKNRRPLLERLKEYLYKI